MVENQPFYASSWSLTLVSSSYDLAFCAKWALFSNLLTYDGSRHGFTAFDSTLQRGHVVLADFCHGHPVTRSLGMWSHGFGQSQIVTSTTALCMVCTGVTTTLVTSYLSISHTHYCNIRIHQGATPTLRSLLDEYGSLNPVVVFGAWV